MVQAPRNGARKRGNNRHRRAHVEGGARFVGHAEEGADAEKPGEDEVFGDDRAEHQKQYVGEHM